MANTQVIPSDVTRCPAAADLDVWSSFDWADGVQIDRAAPLETLVVHTNNSVYEITVVSPATGEVLIRGGRFFPVPTRAQIAGSSLGGSFLKLRGIYRGFCLEIWHDDQTIVTTRVRSIGVPAPARVQ
jgi:hypothetical protein